MNTEKLTWYAARSGGIIAWLLLALGLILGLLLSSRVLGRKASPAWLLSIHRFLGGLSVIFTVVHVAAIMLDDFVSFGWTDVLVPWASEWNPNAVAWGITCSECVQEDSCCKGDAHENCPDCAGTRLCRDARHDSRHL